MEKAPSVSTNTESHEQLESHGLHSLKQTHAIEAELETQEYLRKNPQVLESLLKTGGIALSSLFITYAGGAVEQESIESVSDGKTLSSEVLAEKKILGDELIRATGIDMLRIAESSNFSIEVSGPRDAKKFILHIGQTHLTGIAERDIKATDRTTTVQRAISNALDVLQQKDTTINVIHDEGVFDTDVDHFKTVHELIEKVRPMIALQPSAQSLRELQTMYDTLVRPVISVSGMPENATNAINHVFHEKEKEITDYLESKGILYRALDVQRDNFVAEQRDLDQVQKIFLSGASIQCFAHSKCVLAPAGDLELLNQSNPLEKQIGDLSGRLDTEFSTAFNYLVLKGVVKKDERASLSKLLLDDPGAFLKKVEGKLGHQQVHTLPAIIGELSKLHAQYKEIILIQRERSAIKKLHAHAQADTSEQRIFPLVYGSGHNFTQAVNETNKKLNPEYRYGLITMKYNGTAVPTLELKQK